MSELFILQNQDKLFLSKQKDWVDGRDLNSLFKAAYKDEAINQMVEISAKDYRQRIKIVLCAATEKGLPSIDPEIMPDPLPKAGKDLFAELEADAEVDSTTIDGAMDVTDAETPDLEDEVNLMLDALIHTDDLTVKDVDIDSDAAQQQPITTSSTAQ